MSVVFGKVFSLKKVVGLSWGILMFFVREYINEFGFYGNDDFGYFVKCIFNVCDEYGRQLYIFYVFKNIIVLGVFLNLFFFMYDYYILGILLIVSVLKSFFKIGDIVVNGLEDNYFVFIGFLYGYFIEFIILLLV